MLKGVVNELTNCKSSVGGNSISSSACGNVATISDGKLCIICAVSSDAVVTKEVSLFLEDGSRANIAASNFTDIQFNAEGTMLALWNSKQQFGIVDLSNCVNKLLMAQSNCHEQGSGIEAPLYMLSDKDCSLLSSSRKDGASAVRILKVQWHPLFSTDVVVLLSSNYLLVFHTAAMGGSRQLTKRAEEGSRTVFDVLPLDTTDPIVSFAFGSNSRVAAGSGSNDWQSLCLYLLSNSSMASGSVYVLCPFITLCPLNGGVVSASCAGAVERCLSLGSLRQWADDFSANPALFNSVGSKHDLQLYLRKIRRFVDSLQQSTSAGGDSDPKDCFSPAIQGPLKFTGSSAAGAASRSPCDIAVLESDSFAPSGSENRLESSRDTPVLPPVLVVTYSDSDVEVYMQSLDVYPIFRGGPNGEGSSRYGVDDDGSTDSSSDDDDVVLHINSSARKGPSVVASRPPTSRLFSTPELIFVDSLMVQALVADEAKSSSLGVWRIVCDPILPFCFYLTNFAEGRAFLLCLHWWKHFLAGCSPSLLAGRSGGSSITDSSGGLEECIAAHPMYCIPVLACESIGLAGMACLSNSYIGHKMIFKLAGDRSGSSAANDNGVVMCVNITIHMKLLELQSSLSTSKELFKTLRDAESKASIGLGHGGASSAFEEITLNCLVSIRKALLNVPTPTKLKLKPKEVSISPNLSTASFSLCYLSCCYLNIVCALLVSQSSAVYSKCLSDATAYLEEHLLIPMEELSQRLKYRVELLKHMYTAQVDILHGQRATGDGDYVVKLTAILNKPNKTKADMAE
jgi:hypothetical protein